MARPIKETPILYGRDAKVFTEKMKIAEATPAPKKEYDRVMANYNKIKKIYKECG